MIVSYIHVCMCVYTVRLQSLESMLCKPWNRHNPGGQTIHFTCNNDDWLCLRASEVVLAVAMQRTLPSMLFKQYTYNCCTRSSFTVCLCSAFAVHICAYSTPKLLSPKGCKLIIGVYCHLCKCFLSMPALTLHTFLKRPILLEFKRHMGDAFSAGTASRLAFSHTKH